MTMSIVMAAPVNVCSSFFPPSSALVISAVKSVVRRTVNLKMRDLTVSAKK